MRIAILTPSVTSGDAVSNDVLGMYDVLNEKGATVRVFAEGWTLQRPAIVPWPKIERFLKKPTDILIYHYSRGWAPGLDLLRKLDCRKVVKYHNVTPPEFVARYSPDFANMCREGRQQLTPIARSGSDLYLSASAYNMQELIAEGAAQSRSFVVPPFHHIDRLHSIASDSAVMNSCKNGKTNILMVGRVSPNKGHPALIAAFAAYHHDYNRNSQLVIVGKEETRLARYSKLLREMIRRLKLRDAVVFTGEVSDHALRAYYQVADVFMITSNHEGFCVPLVEAMSMRVPIIAYASSAIPETVGDAGLVWDEPNPYYLAESINSIVKNQSLRQALAEKGRQRYEQHFTNRETEAKFLAALREVL